MIAAVLSTAVILALAAPALGMKLNIPDESARPGTPWVTPSYAAMAQGFGPGFDAPLIIAARLPRPGGHRHAHSRDRATPGVAHVTPVVISRDGQAALMIAYPTTAEQNPATNTLVNHIGDTVLPRATAGTGIRAYVTGPNAGNVTSPT